MSSAVQRLEQVAKQLLPAGDSKARVAGILEKHPDDVVICLAQRTALTKAKKGYFKDTPLSGLIHAILTNLLADSKLPASLIEEIVLGNALHKEGPYTLRATAIHAGFPPSTAISTVSRWCSSGLLAVESVAHKIAQGSIDIGIAVGAESMSGNPDNGAPVFEDQEMMQNQTVCDVRQPMAWTSENVARDFGVSRERQDEVAARSQQRAERAQKEGWFAEEIVPVKARWRDPKASTSSDDMLTVTVDRDDGIRPGTTKEALSKIRAAFPQWPPSTTTGGNASQVTDGAAGVLLMRRSVADKLGVKIIGKFVKSTVVGLEPRVMGIGPAYAIPKLLGKVGIETRDVDLFEINEAFASMLVYCIDKLQLDPEKVNPRGGAIAFGHPLGCTGARQIVTALAELKRTGGKLAVTSMCVGTGMGMASLIVSEQ